MDSPQGMLAILERGVAGTLFENAGEVIAITKADPIGDLPEGKLTLQQQGLSLGNPHLQQMIDDGAPHILFEYRVAIYG